MNNLALWDMDGTLSDDRHRRPLYLPGKWSEYWLLENILADSIFPEGLAKVRELEEQGWQIGILTARTDELNRESTESWLIEHGIHADPILMRPRALGFLRPAEFKSRVVEDYINSGKYSHVTLYENDFEVVEAVQARTGPDTAVFCQWETATGT